MSHPEREILDVAGTQFVMVKDPRMKPGSFMLTSRHHAENMDRPPYFYDLTEDPMQIQPTYLTMTNGISFLWPLERPHFATVTRVVDGDTIRCDIDMDLKSALLDYPVRLAGCNAWEKSTEPGKAAQAHLTELLPPGTRLVLTTIKDYKYGGEFVAKAWSLAGVDIVAMLVAQQWLAPWDGNGKASDHVPPWPRTVTP